MRKLRDEGYYCVRSAGSKGAIDVVAIGNGNLRLIQSKASKEKTDYVVDSFAAIDLPIGCRIESWHKIPRKGWDVEVLFEKKFILPNKNKGKYG